MISFACRCGHRIHVPPEQAGKTTRCPRCARGVVVPPHSTCPLPRPLAAGPVDPVPAPPRKGHSRPSARATTSRPPSAPRGIPQAVLGLAVLATICAPWFIFGKGASVSGLGRSPRSGPVMSWDILSEAPTGIGVFLVSSWIVALAGVAVGLAGRGLPRAVANAGLGLTGLLFFLTVGIDGISPPRWAGQASSVLVTLSLVLLPGLLVAGHTRLRFGQSLAMRVLLCGLGAVVAALVLVLLILLQVHFFKLASAARRGFILDLAWLTVGLMVLIGGCLVLTVDGGIRKIAPRRCAGGLGLTYVGLAFVALYLVIRPNVPALLAGGTRDYVLMPLYLLLMLILFAVLLCGGALQVTRRSIEFWLRRKEFAGGPPPAV